MKEENEKPKAFTIKYKRPRGSRACVVCRSRKVRCDAEIHIPCTNCITFGCECTVPEAKKRGNTSNSDSRAKRKQNQSAGQPVNMTRDNRSINSDNSSHEQHFLENGKTNITSEPVLNISQVSVPPSLHSNYKTGTKLSNAEILMTKNIKPLTFLGSSSIAIVAQKAGQNHVELTNDLFDESDNSLDSVELEILKLRGAFLLPSNELALDLVESYFKYVHPLMPVINRTEFMKKFKDPNDSPSLMLLQSVLLCGSRVSRNPLLLDSKGSSNLASMTFFRRAKALYETNYENDPVSLIQSLILIGSYWEGPEDVTKNSWYWNRIAVTLAQGFGFHRDVSNSSSLSKTDVKIWKRIWWCLFEKDRNIAIAFGRPSMIDLNDCDVPMLTLDDFNEDEEDEISPYKVDETQALYFIHLVKLAEITGIIVKHQYTVKAESMKRKNKFPIIQHCDMLMGIWFTNLPPQLVFSLQDKSTQNFFSCLINAQYYNRLYLIHRSNLSRMAKSNSTNPNNYKYPSWGISFQAARMISIVSKTLLDNDEIKYCPSMFVYILFSALLMLIYHVDSPNQVIASTASDSLFVSKAVLRELAKYWPVAGILVKLFDKTANNKFKRAKIIENLTKAEDYQELEAQKKSMGQDANYGVISRDIKTNATDNHRLLVNESLNHNREMDSPTANSITSGISPGGQVYPREIKTEDIQTTAPLNSNLDELVQQLKQKENNEAHTESTSSKKTNCTSPTSSTQSFPDFSLVTENIPKQNFFENFEPTQLFPDVRTNPPSQAQSPVPQHDIHAHHEDSLYHEATSPSNLNTNFVDQSFINMNLSSNVNNYVNDDLGSLFNFQG